MIELTAGKYRGLRRIADADGRFRMVALDLRRQIAEPIAASMPANGDLWTEVIRFKRLLGTRLQHEASAVLADPEEGIPALADVLDPSCGLLVTLEDHRFRETPGGRLSASLPGWTPETIRRCGGDAVKFLLWYRPDAAPDVVRHQQELVREIGRGCQDADIPFVLELLVYPLPGETGEGSDYVEMRGKRAELVLDSVRSFAGPEFGVDLFKLESPVPMHECDGSPGVQAQFDALAKAAGRPWVLLSAGADGAVFLQALRHAYAAGASGYLAGRAIWKKALAIYPDWRRLEAEVSGSVLETMQEINRLSQEQARPWNAHPAWAPVLPQTGRDFAVTYAGNDR